VAIKNTRYLVTEPDKDLLAIHQGSLEVDCEGQPQRMFLWGQELAKARKESKRCKNRLKLVYAEIDKEVRENPGEFSLDKVTEKAVEACVLQHPEYQKMQTDLIEAEYSEDILDSFVKSLHERGDMIRGMISLHGQQYWSKPDTQQHKREQQIPEPKVTRRKHD
jgi:hypothetical protein